MGLPSVFVRGAGRHTVRRYFLKFLSLNLLRENWTEYLENVSKLISVPNTECSLNPLRHCPRHRLDARKGFECTHAEMASNDAGKRMEEVYLHSVSPSTAAGSCCCETGILPMLLSSLILQHIEWEVQNIRSSISGPINMRNRSFDTQEMFNNLFVVHQQSCVRKVTCTCIFVKSKFNFLVKLK